MITNQGYKKWVSITPSDTVNFVPQGTTDDLCSAIYVGGAGVVVAVQQDGTTGSFTCIAGQILPVKAKRVNSTSTTATLLMALYDI